MKNLILLILLGFSCSIWSQTACIDTTLINPNAICPMIWAPVCGCDGVTYSNDCVAVNTAGVTSWVEGECGTATGCVDLEGIDFGFCGMVIGVGVNQGSCMYISGCGTMGNDGVDYASSIYSTMEECELNCGDACTDLSGLDFGLCDMSLGVIWNGSACVYLSGCDWTIGGVDYSGAFFDTLADCEYACGGSNCIDLNLIDPTVVCDGTLAPVCGCDSVTYLNACVAEFENGVLQFVDGPCENPTNCVIEEQIYLVVCPDIWDPVCGCDGVTYSNDCNAWFVGGVQSWTLGECGINSLDEEELFVKISPNPFQSTLHIHLPISGKFSVELRDLSGRLFMQNTFSQYSGVLQTDDLSKGLYLLIVRDSRGRTSVQKVMKE